MTNQCDKEIRQNREFRYDLGTAAPQQHRTVVQNCAPDLMQHIYLGTWQPHWFEISFPLTLMLHDVGYEL